MKHAIMTLILMAATPAFADGFRCNTVFGDLNVKVYNHTQPEEGTRNVATMIISDPSVQYGRKTIAKFSDINNTLSSKSAVYEAKVDLRFVDSRRGGENIGGTKLAELKKIIVDVDFSYANPVEDEAELPGTLTLVKRDGEELSSDLDCVRYLKGE